MKYILIILLFAGCRTVKYIDRIHVETDSTSLHERDSILQVKREDSIYFKTTMESLGSSDVVFRDTGSVRIEYFPDGSISVIEGQVRTLSNRLNKSQSETGIWKMKYDSLIQVKTKDSAQVKTEYQKEVITKKVSVIPWWVWPLLAGMLIIGYRFSKIKLPFLNS